MAKRFFCPFFDERASRYDIEIWDSDFAGTALEFRAGPDGFSLRYALRSERTTVVSATECTITMQMQSVGHELLVSDLLSAPEGRFTVLITKGASPVLYWVGMVLPDIGSVNEEDYPIEFQVRATDGLGLLKNYKFKDTAGAYTGKQRVIEHLAKALGKLPYVATHFGASDIFIRSAVDWWEETMANSAFGADALNFAYLDHSAWVKYSKGEEDYRTCYDVVNNILAPLGATITQADGAFWIEQPTYRAAATIVTRRYSKSGGFLSSANYAGSNVLDRTASGALLAVGQYEFFPALAKATHVFKALERRNYLSAAKISEASPTQQIYYPLQSNGSSTVLRLTGNLSGQVFNTGPAPPITAALVVVFKITILLDTKSLKRPYTIDTNYQINYGASEWDTAPQVCFYAVTLPGGLPTGGAYYTQAIDIEIPAIPEDAASFLFGVQFDSFRYFTGATLSPSSYVFRWTLQNPWLEVYSNGTPVLLDDEVEYETINTIHSDNSTTLETESLVGYSTDPNTIGALWVKPASTYVLGGDWGEGTDPQDRPLEKLLTEFAVSGQATPIRRLSGTLFGDIIAMRRVYWLETYWLLLGGEYNAGRNQFAGEWVELKYLPGLSASPPRRRRLVNIEPPLPPSPTAGLNGSKGIYEIVSKPPGTVMYPVSQSTTDSEILAGAITSLPVTVPLAAGDYFAGDTITIVNPLSMVYESLVVGTTSSASDTAIDVSGTLAHDYPENSPIIRKPATGTYSLPAGQAGQILWHNGSRWVPMGDTSMPENWILTWNDATGWTAKAPPAGTITGSGAAGQVATWSGSTAITGKNTLFLDAANDRLGILTVSPAQALHVEGAARITGSSGTATVILGRNASGDLSAYTIVVGDIPSLPASIITSGILSYLFGGTGTGVIGTAGQLARVNSGATALEYFTAAFLTANQTITLTGDVTGSGATSIAATIAANAVTLAKFQQIATASFLGRDTAGTGNAEVLSVSQVRALLSISNVENTALSTWAGSTNLTTLGTVTVGVWSGTVIAVARGGTGTGVIGTAGQYLRVNAAATALEYATLSALSGTLTATRIPFATGASTLADDLLLSWNNTTKRLSVGNTGGSPVATVHIAEGSVASWEPLRAAGTISGNMIISLLNFQNAGGASSMILDLGVGGSGAGDSALRWLVNGVGTWCAGVDNSNSDKWILGYQTLPGGGADWLTVTTTGQIGVRNSSPLHPLDVIGRARATLVQGVLGSFTSIFGTGAGTTPTLGDLSGVSNGFSLQFTTGTAPTASGNIISITLPTSYSATMYPVFSAANAQTATDIAKFFVSAATGTAFTLTANGTLSASTTYRLYFNTFGR